MRPKLGWHRELPDRRDYHVAERPEIMSNVLASPKLSLFGKLFSAGMTGRVDLTDYCSPIEDQLDIGSCTAQAGVGLVEYMERRGRGVHVDASRLFLYKVTRNMLGWTGDTGAYVRETLKAMGKFGLCPESVWPYDTRRFDDEPSAFCYAYAQSARSLSYYRLDKDEYSWETVEKWIKTLLSFEIPSVFGFTVYNFGDSEGLFEMPGRHSSVYGGHAVMCVGYDDDYPVPGASPGAFQIRNSWGMGWGSDGYGWIPYAYLHEGLTADWWAVFSQDYLGD